MAGKTDRTAVQYAFKKLSGRANTSNIKSDAQEVIGSTIQAGTQTLFGQDIPLSASRVDYSIYSASNGGPKTAEYVVFTVSQITGTTYDADSATGGGGDGSQSAGPHGYKLFMTGNYTSLSSNTKAGTYPFTNGTLVHETLGKLQLIPPNFSQEAPNPYILKIYEADSGDPNQIGDEIPLLDEVDWTFDYYNGILFLQDYDAAKIPAFARGFIYVGDYLSATLGSATGTPGGANTQVQFNDGGAFGGDSNFTFNKSTDAMTVTNMSGALTQLSDGTSYLVAGDNVTITSASTGQITISSTGGGGGGTGTVTSGSFNVPNPAAFVTTASISFAGGEGFNFTADSVGADTYFFASGAIDSRGTTNPGTAVFGGDLVVSGALALNQGAAAGSQVFVTSEGKVGIGTSTPAYKLTVGGSMEVGEYIYHRNDTNTSIRFQADDIEIEAGGRAMIKMSEGATDQVLIMSGGGASSLDPKGFADTNFFVSGTIGSTNTSNAGTSTFGGDVVVSGALDAKQGVGTLKTATSVVHVSASNAPTSGSVLVAKSPTEAEWQQAIVFGEQPSGTKNANNLTFSLNKAPINGTDLMLFVNGLLQLSGTSGDYELTGSTINFKLAPYEDDSISAIYRPSS